jgi:hypothetical protein
MMRFEKSVTKYFVQNVLDHLHKVIKEKGITFPPKSDTLRVDPDERSRYYVIALGGYGPVAWLYLERQKGWEAWEVMQVYVNPEFRGRGFARRLYDDAIVNDGIMLASGKTQSKYTRGLWESFIRSERYDLFAIDFKDLDSVCPVFWDAESEMVWSDLKLYFTQNDPAYEQNRDVRLIATRKKE